MKNAEMKVVPINGDVMTASGGSTDVWGSYNRAVFWDFDDNKFPAFYLYDGTTKEQPNLTNLHGQSTFAADAFQNSQGQDRISYTSFLSQELDTDGSTLGGTSLSSLLSTSYHSGYNGIYSFTNDGTKFTFKKIN